MGSQNELLGGPEQSPSMRAQACSGSAQASSPAAQVKAAAAHVERLKRKQCEKILGLSMGVSIPYTLCDYSAALRWWLIPIAVLAVIACTVHTYAS
jgi:hypothetical protein